MLISSGSSHLVLRLKKYSDQQNSSSHGQHVPNKSGQSSGSPKLDENSLAINIDSLSNHPSEIQEDHSILGRFLQCKPCRQVTEHHQSKIVRI